MSTGPHPSATFLVRAVQAARCERKARATCAVVLMAEHEFIRRTCPFRAVGNRSATIDRYHTYGYLVHSQRTNAFAQPWSRPNATRVPKQSRRVGKTCLSRDWTTTLRRFPAEDYPRFCRRGTCWLPRFSTCLAQTCDIRVARRGQNSIVINADFRTKCRVPARRNWQLHRCLNAVVGPDGPALSVSFAGSQAALSVHGLRGAADRTEDTTTIQAK